MFRKQKRQRHARTLSTNTADASAGLAIPGLPNGTILIKNKTVAVPNHMRGKETRSRGKPGFRWVTHRTGPLCTPAFAMTDQKSQGKQFSEVLVNLRGVHSSGTATRPSFMSLYVQLSRAQSWNGLHLFRTALSTSQVYQVKSSSQVKSSQVKSSQGFSKQVKSSRCSDLT
jgi:hypothetical protein